MPDEQLQLIARLADRARALRVGSTAPQMAGDLRECAAPLVGEDAQDWVSRTRRESDDHR